MKDITKTQLTVKFIDGPMRDKEYGSRPNGWFPPRIQVPFMTDQERITSWGTIERVFEYITYELKTWVNPQGNKESVYVLVHDDAFRQYQRFEANPALLGAKWHEDDAVYPSIEVDS